MAVRLIAREYNVGYAIIHGFTGIDNEQPI